MTKLKTFTTLLLSLFIVCFFFNVTKKKKLKLEQNVNLSMISSKDEDRNTIQETYKDSNIVIPKDIHLINMQNETVQIDNIVTGKCIILYFSSEQCGDCVDFALSCLKDFIPEIDSNKVLVFASKYRLRDLIVFKKENQFTNPFFLIDSFDIGFENHNMPFMFICNEDLNASCFFIPQKERFINLVQYFECVKDGLKKNS